MKCVSQFGIYTKEKYKGVSKRTLNCDIAKKGFHLKMKSLFLYF
jgi:hypothetical protein